jgi:hypothetical protein
MIDTDIKDSTKESVGSTRHHPTYDSNSINRAVEKSTSDPNFLNNAIKLLEKMQFPAFKHNIIDYTTKVTSDKDVVSLFESLNGYIKFENLYQVRKAIEGNNPESKKTYQISGDQTRYETDVQSASDTSGYRIDDKKRTKEIQSMNKNEERKDYPEVTPTAMRNFICDKCGKPFQNQDDLAQHRIFEKEDKV